jgi:hypothetical protein
MSRIEIQGIDGLMARFNQASSELRPIVEEALRESGEALAEELLAQEKRFKDPTGELGLSITLTDPWHRGSASGVYQNYTGNYVGARGGNEGAGRSGARRAAFVAHSRRRIRKHFRAASVAKVTFLCGYFPPFSHPFVK